jgi:hypothetical protein
MADERISTAGDSIDDANGLLTEIRVHGVSGTPPEALLRLPRELIELDTGDGVAGFYKPRFDLVPDGGEDDDRVSDESPRWRRAVQAYSWGGLTSGPASRAVWVLFLPFILINLAHWMLPQVTRPAAASMSVRLLRMLGLSLTLTLMLAAAVVTMDVAGWQCAALDSCVAQLGPASVLGGQHPGARVAFSAIPVLIVIVVLWKLGQEDQRRVGIPPDPADASSRSPLEQNEFWAGDPSVARLRACHVAAWASTLGALALAPTLRYGIEWSRPAALLLLGPDGLVLLAAVVATWFNRATGRGTAEGDEAPAWVTVGLSWLRWAALVLVAGSLLVVGFGPMRDGEIPVPSHLPALRGAIYVLLAVQVVLLAALFGSVVWSQRGRRQAYRAGFTPTLRGYTAPVVATLGWLIGVSFSVGVTLMVAVYLGDPVVSTANAKREYQSRAAILADPAASFADHVKAFDTEAALIVPPPYLWSAAANIVVVVAVVLTVVYAWRRLVPTWAKAQLPEVEAETEGDDPAQAKVVASARGWAALTDRGVGIVAGLVAFTVLLIAISAIVYFSTTFDYVPGLNAAFTKVSVLITSGLAAAFVGLAVRAFRDRQLRRVVAVLWDVITFWPRANHPLTPPCYGERVVPELLLHTRSLISDGPQQKRVVIAAHSQGTIIAAAALLLADATTCDRVGLLTFGCPLRRLYARNFPNYFGHYALSSVRMAEDGRWINLWALSDPIGGYVFDHQNRDLAIAPDTVDVRILDTTTLAANPDGTHEPICGHSGFWTRHEYEDAMTVIEGRLVPAEITLEGPRLGPPTEQAV